MPNHYSNFDRTSGPVLTPGIGHALDIGHVGQPLDIKAVSNGEEPYGKGFSAFRGVGHGVSAVSNTETRASIDWTYGQPLYKCVSLPLRVTPT